MSERSKMPYEEQKRLGQAIYDAQIRHLIAPEDEGKYVLVDVLTGDYEIDERSVEARVRLRKAPPGSRHPHHAPTQNLRWASYQPRVVSSAM